MALWCEEKYLRQLSPQLEHFKQRHAHTYNFRCPICGDSERIKSKSRGYVFPKGDIYMFKCHNCGIALPLSALLKRLSKTLYDEYLMEKLKDARPVVQQWAPEPQKRPQTPSTDAGLVAPLSRCTEPTDPLYRVYQYVKNRAIPEAGLKRLFGTKMAFDWLLPLVGEEKAKKVKNGILYLVLPLRMPDRSWFGCQVRPIDEKLYTTFRWSQEPLKVFGLEVWTPTKPTFIVEGPLDSLFVPNALAICGSDLLGGVRVLQDADVLPVSESPTYIWDNEPRNTEVKKQLEIAVKLHERVVIWPNHFPKDINDMVKAEIDVLKTIQARTYQGLLAELEFHAWSR